MIPVYAPSDPDVLESRERGTLRALLSPGSAAACLLALVLAACGGSSGGDDASGDDGSGDDGVPDSAFDPAVAQVLIEIDYTTGAEPYTGDAGVFGDIWGLFRSNADRLFAGTREVAVPSSLDDMEEIGPAGASDFTVDDILAKADQYRDEGGDSTTVTFYVLFIDGYFADDEGRQDTVLGVSIGRTGVIAMFKPVIESTSQTLFPNLSRFVEQSSLIHEFGHAVGLVNNGVAMVTRHQDTEHGAHCDNDRCVMFWLNEGASDAAEFARMYVLTGDTILFGPECLEDVDSLTGGPMSDPSIAE